LTIGTISAPGTAFPRLATSCSTGLNLPPGSTCTFDYAFHPTVSGSNADLLRVEYAASDAPPDTATKLALSGEGVAAGDPVFANGFETVSCEE
jgi:hypothetical protein